MTHQVPSSIAADGPSAPPGGRASLFPRAEDVFRSVGVGDLHPLIEGEQAERIRHVSGQWPFPIESCGYEIRLAKGEDRLDFALCQLNLNNPCLQADWRQMASALLDRDGAGSPWVRTFAFLQHWARRDSPLFRNIPFAWLAFDAEPGTQTLPYPCLSLCLDPGFHARRIAAGNPPHMPLAELKQLMELLHFDLMGIPMPRKLGHTLSACHASLPEGGMIKHISFMLARTPCTVKVNVSLPGSSIPGYLAELDRCDLASAAGDLIEAYCPYSEALRLNLVLWPSLANHLELELPSGAGIAGDGRRHFLQVAVSDGLCCPQKGRILADILSNGLQVNARRAGSIPTAMGWYAKIRYAPETGAHAKAYLALMPRIWSLAPPAMENRVTRQPVAFPAQG